MTKRIGLKDNKQQRRHFDVSIVQIKIYSLGIAKVIAFHCQGEIFKLSIKGPEI